MGQEQPCAGHLQPGAHDQRDAQPATAAGVRGWVGSGPRQVRIGCRNNTEPDGSVSCHVMSGVRAASLQGLQPGLQVRAAQRCGLLEGQSQGSGLGLTNQDSINLCLPVYSPQAWRLSSRTTSGLWWVSCWEKQTEDVGAALLSHARKSGCIHTEPPAPAPVDHLFFSASLATGSPPKATLLP